MPRSEKQKQKLFRLLEILMRDTDESHGLSMPEIISKLSEYGITAERKSIYDDIITLGEMGFDVITLPTRPPKYSLLSRPFEIFLSLIELERPRKLGNVFYAVLIAPYVQTVDNLRHCIRVSKIRRTHLHRRCARH